MRQTHLSNNQSNNRLHESKSRDPDKDVLNQTDHRLLHGEGISPSIVSPTPHKKKISLKNYLKQST